MSINRKLIEQALINIIHIMKCYAVVKKERREGGKKYFMNCYESFQYLLLSGKVTQQCIKYLSKKEEETRVYTYIP